MSAPSHLNRLRRVPLFGAVTGAALVFLYLPLLVVAAYSFNATRSITVWSGFSLHWYGEALSNPVIRDAAINSLIVASISATAATVLATLAALGLGRGRPLRGQTAMAGLVSLPLMVPEVVTAVASLAFFAAIGLPLGYVAIILAHTVFGIPFAYLPIAARLATLPSSLDEAARDLYASPTVMARTVILPLLAPGIAAGFMLAFIASLDDFVIASFLTGGGTATLPVALFGLARTGFTPEINAVATLMLAASVAVVALSLLLTLRGRRG